MIPDYIIHQIITEIFGGLCVTSSQEVELHATTGDVNGVIAAERPLLRRFA